jgi:hypothetical protein
LAYWVLVRLPVVFIQEEAAHAFIDGVRGQELELHFLMGSDRLLNKALIQFLKLEMVNAAAGLQARLQEVTLEHCCHQLNIAGMDSQYACYMGMLVTSA